MIFRRNLSKEISFNTGAIFMILLALVATTLTVRLLGSASNGTVNPKDIFQLIGLGMVGQVGILLTASIFISNIMMLTRWHKDSEMIIWQISGISHKKILIELLKQAIPLVIIITVLNFFVTPWANEQSEAVKKRYQEREDISMLSPGQFKESFKSNRVLFTESIDVNSNTIKHFFLSDFGNQKQKIVVAKTGFIENTTDGERFLILNNGRRYEGVAGEPDFRILEFDRYTLKLDERFSSDTPPSTNLSTTSALISQWGNLASKGEFAWRLGLSVMSFGLIFLTIPLSHYDPRRGRHFSLVLAVLAYFTYSNIIKLSQSWISSNKLSFEVLIWLPHAVVITLAILLILRKNYQAVTFRYLINQFLTKN